MRRKIFVGATAILLIWNISSCKKANEETLAKEQGVPANCNTTGMKYSVDILPIIHNNCYSCHAHGQTEGGINLEGYANLKRQVDNNKLINVIKHSPGFSPMPQGLPKLSSCDIAAIQSWINNGAPDN